MLPNWCLSNSQFKMSMDFTMAESQFDEPNKCLQHFLIETMIVTAYCPSKIFIEIANKIIKTGNPAQANDI